MKIKNVAVFLGGNSAERNISIQSGYSVVKSLLEMNFSVYPIDMKYFCLDLFKKKSFDKIFISLHGKGGEDGSIQGFLDVLDIPYTGSNVFASSISINKFLTKLLVRNLNINIVPDIYINKYNFKKYYLRNSINNFYYEEIFSILGSPVLIKPNNLGSSIGIKIIDNILNLKLCLCDCYKKYGDLLIEKYILGDEYTVGILNGKVLPIIKIKPKNIFYDYESKYLSKSEYFYPNGLNSNIENTLIQNSLDIWNLLKCKGCIRIDFLVDKNDNIWFLEINTVPGMTNLSLLPFAANIIGIKFNDLVKKILYA